MITRALLKKKLFSLNFKASKRWSVYYFMLGIASEITGIVFNINYGDGVNLSIGTNTPIEELWNKGYRVAFGGYVFFQPVIMYINKD